MFEYGYLTLYWLCIIRSQHNVKPKYDHFSDNFWKK